MIGKKIKLLRTGRGITQQQVANALKVSKKSISLWENDKSDPNLRNIKLITLFFNTSFDELIGMEHFEYYFEYRHNDTILICKENKKN